MRGYYAAYVRGVIRKLLICRLPLPSFDPHLRHNFIWNFVELRQKLRSHSLTHTHTQPFHQASQQTNHMIVDWELNTPVMNSSHRRQLIVRVIPTYELLRVRLAFILIFSAQQLR